MKRLSPWVRFCVVWYELIFVHWSFPVEQLFDFRGGTWYGRLGRTIGICVRTVGDYLLGYHISWYWARPVLQEHWERQDSVVAEWRFRNPDHTYEKMCEFVDSWNRAQGRRV